MFAMDDLVCGHQRRPVVSGVTASVQRGELLAVLGPNGAGKTTLVETVMGLLPVLGGTMTLDGRDITRLGAYERARSGITWVPEGRRLWHGMTVLENIHLGARGAPKARRADLIGRATETFPRLTELAKRTVDSLSGGEQQMVAIARALAAGPDLLVLDEPSLGLAPQIVESIFESLRSTLENTAVILIEQNVEVGLLYATRGIVLAEGGVMMEGLAADLSDSTALHEAYVSGVAHRAAPASANPVHVRQV